MTGRSEQSVRKELRWKFTVAAAAAMLVTSACSTPVPGTPQADPSVSVRLDAGNFPTTPRVVGKRVGADEVIQGSMALASYLVAPAEVDSKFDVGAYSPITIMPDSSTLLSTLGKDIAGVMLGHVGGANTAQKVDMKGRTAPAAQMNTMMLRFETPDAATTRLGRLRTVAPPAGVAGTSLAKYKDAYEGATPEGLSGSPQFWLEYKEYLVGVGFINIASRPEIERLATGYFDKQLPRLDSIPFSPMDTRIFTQTDNDGIMRLTRLEQPMPDGGYYATGWFTPHAWSVSTTGSWKTTTDSLARAGIEVVANSANTIMRARDPEGANIFVRLSTEKTEAGDRDETAAPGVPGVVCASGLTTANGRERRVYACTFALGRYVALNTGASLLAAQQGAAASYLTLKDAK